MIYLIMGRPGGGKSYEATVYHVLPALLEGRKVITNLPLNIPHIRAIVPDLKGLLEIRKTSASGDPDQRVFGTVDDYGDEWRHPDTGVGPLYVIDECHKPLPKIGTSRAVEEWFAEHRHETADVILISQSYRKLNPAICDMVDVVYMCQKATALGSPDHYIRKVKWGVRGEAVNTAMRKYEPQYFPLYQSHTRGGGMEAGAKDIRPIWRHWSVMGAGLFVGISVVWFGYNMATGVSLFGVKDKVTPTKPETFVEYRLSDFDEPVLEEPFPDGRPSPLHVAPSDPTIAAAAAVAADLGPFQGMGMHVLGWMKQNGRELYAVALSVNGATSRVTTSDELERVGYQVEPVGECAFRLRYGTDARWVRCDSPVVTMSPFNPKGATVEPAKAIDQPGEGSPHRGEGPPA